MRNIGMWSFSTLSFSELFFRETSLENKIASYSLSFSEKFVFDWYVQEKAKRPRNFSLRKLLLINLKSIYVIPLCFTSLNIELGKFSYFF